MIIIFKGTCQRWEVVPINTNNTNYNKIVYINYDYKYSINESKVDLYIMITIVNGNLNYF